MNENKHISQYYLLKKKTLNFAIYYKFFLKLSYKFNYTTPKVNGINKNIFRNVVNHTNIKQNHTKHSILRRMEKTTINCTMKIKN